MERLVRETTGAPAGARRVAPRARAEALLGCAAAAALLRRAAAALAGALLTACSGGGGETAPDPFADCSDIAIDRFMELAVVDQEVVSDARASNAASGAWSFRHLVEELAPPGMTPEEMVRRWIVSYTTPTKVNLYPVPPRDSVVPAVLCPWWKQTPSNGCDADCLACAAEELDLAKAPFRLMAITNRIDLRETATAPNTAGEGRLLFALTNGPADDPASEPLPMSVIMEFRLPTYEGVDARTWAERWHALSSFSDRGEDFRQALQDITDAFTKRGADPAIPDLPPLGQLRTNERAFFWLWQQRELKLTQSGLDVSGTHNTPDRSVNNTAALRTFLLENEAAIMKGRHVVPPNLTGGASDQEVVWRADVPEPLRAAFARETCNGCHLTENPAVDIAFHVSPFRTGIDRLSPFMNDPEDPTQDDLARREASMRRALCGQ